MKEENNSTPTPVLQSIEGNEFLKYVDEARDEFVSFIRSMEWRNDLRTHVDSLLICFDQMKERLKDKTN